MKKFFLSPFVIIALFVGAYSFYLARKGQYEAAMVGAGVAVAAATARRDDEEKEDSIKQYLLQQKLILTKENEQLRLSLAVAN